jgi:hypothetical protein
LVKLGQAQINLHQVHPSPEIETKPELPNQLIPDPDYILDERIEIGLGASVIHVRHAQRKLPGHTHP